MEGRFGVSGLSLPRPPELGSQGVDAAPASPAWSRPWPGCPAGAPATARPPRLSTQLQFYLSL